MELFLCPIDSSQTENSEAGNRLIVIITGMVLVSLLALLSLFVSPLHAYQFFLVILCGLALFFSLLPKRTMEYARLFKSEGLSSYTPLRQIMILAMGLITLLLIGVHHLPWVNKYDAVEYKAARQAMSISNDKTSAQSEVKAIAPVPNHFPGSTSEFFELTEQIFYDALKLVIWGEEGDTISPWEIAARDSLIAMQFFVILELLIHFLRSGLHTMVFWYGKIAHRIPWGDYENIVILGCGSVGYSLMESVLKDSKFNGTVTIIEQNAKKDKIRVARQLGAVFIDGDGTDEDLHDWVGIQHADEVYCVMGDDQINVETAQHIIAERKDRIENSNIQFSEKRKLKIYVHASQEFVIDIIKNPEELSKWGIEVYFFRAVETATTELVGKKMIKYKPQKDEVAHFVIFGFGELGQSLVYDLATLAHYDNHKRSRISIIHGTDKDELDRLQRFKYKHPYFTIDKAPAKGILSFDAARDNWDYNDEKRQIKAETLDEKDDVDRLQPCINYVANAEFIPVPDAVFNEEIVQGLTDLYHDPNVKLNVIICHDEDHKGLELGSRLKRELDKKIKPGPQLLPIFVGLPNQPHLAKLLNLTGHDDFDDEQTQDKTNKQIITLESFAVCEDIITRNLITKPVRLDLAQHFKYTYDVHAGYANPGLSDLQIAELWGKDKLEFRRSNLIAAAHCDVKIRVFKPRKVDGKKKLIITDESMLIAQKMEHYRWVAERLMDGWTYYPYDPEQRNNDKEY